MVDRDHYRREAAPQLREATEQLRRVLGDEDPRTLEMMAYLGWEVLRSENKLSARVEDIFPSAAPAVGVSEVEEFPAQVTALFEHFAPISSAIASESSSTRRPDGSRLPKMAMHPTTKAISVAIGMPQPSAPGLPDRRAR